MSADAALRTEVSDVLRRLIACDTSNPPGREAAAAAILEDVLTAAGVECERVAKDPDRPNLVATLRGTGDGPSLAFLGHLDVVPARREDWATEPFAGLEDDGWIVGRGSVDMKCHVAAAAVALATLAREGFRPRGDVMLVVTADEEDGSAGVGAPFLVDARPDLSPDYVVGEGAGERISTPNGPIYLLDRGVKASAEVTLTVRGLPGDASLPGTGSSAVYELARLLTRLEAYRPPARLLPEVEPLVAAVAGTQGSDDERVDRARGAHPALDRLVRALTTNVFEPTNVEATGPKNVVAAVATATLYCALLPGTTRTELERELRSALGPGPYELDASEPEGGRVSPAETSLRDAIEEFLREHDPGARLVPALGYGFSDCDVFRERYGSTAYGFVPFRHADPLTNFDGKHGLDERVLVDDLVVQALAARHVARRIGVLDATATQPRA